MDNGVVWSDERVDEGVLQQFGHMGRLENAIIAQIKKSM